MRSSHAELVCNRCGAAGSHRQLRGEGAANLIVGITVFKDDDQVIVMEPPKE